MALPEACLTSSSAIPFNSRSSYARQNTFEVFFDPGVGTLIADPVKCQNVVIEDNCNKGDRISEYSGFKQINHQLKGKVEVYLTADD
jgi:hypothetical protein